MSEKKFSKSLSRLLNDNFILFTSIESFLLALLYFWRGVEGVFTIRTWIVISFNLIYVPVVLLSQKRFFSWFYLIYGLTLVFLISMEESFLFNNYTALFVICIVVGIQPKLKIPAISLYFLCVCIAFGLNDETLIHFFIHIVRSVWFIQVVGYVLNNKYDRKKLILFEDEKMILDQLCDGKVYQKEVEGFSENTIYRKLKAARERNGNITREQLVDLYRKEKEKNQNMEN